MLKTNLIMLRNIHGFSQEEIAEKIDIPVRLMQNGRVSNCLGHRKI